MKISSFLAGALCLSIATFPSAAGDDIIIFQDRFTIGNLTPAPADLSVDVFLDGSRMNEGGQLELLVSVTDPSGTPVFNQRGQQDIRVSWTSLSPGVATVDSRGLVQAIAPGTAVIQASIDDSTDTATITVEAARAAAGDRAAPNLAAINIDPTRQSITLENPAVPSVFRLFGIDTFGAPSPLDCTVPAVLSSNPGVVSASYDGTLGNESLSLTAQRLGSTLIALDCDGFISNQVVVQVNAPVSIPNPSPFGTANFGYRPDLLLDGPNKHACSYDATNRDLVYSAFDGIWASEIVSSSGSDYGRECQVMLDSLRADLPTICSADGTALKCFIRLSSGGWLERTVDPSISSQATNVGEIDAVMDSQGRILVAYYDTTESAIKLATSIAPTRDDWVTETILSGNVQRWLDLELTPNEDPRIAISHAEGAFYGQPSAGGWIFERISSAPGAGTGIRLELPQTNSPQVIYYTGNGTMTYHIKRVEPGLGTLWVPQVVESLNVPNEFQFELAPGRYGLPKMVYFDASGGRLALAFQDTIQRLGLSGSFFLERPAQTGPQAQNASLKVDDQFRANIFYLEPGSGGASPNIYIEPIYPNFGPPPVSVNQPITTLNVSDPIPGVPGAPQVTPSIEEINISWSPANEAVSYRLYWNTSGNVSLSDSFFDVGNQTSFLHQGLDSNLTYFYRVVAVGPIGLGAFSAESSVSPDPVPPPTQEPPVLVNDSFSIREVAEGYESLPPIPQWTIQDADNRPSDLSLTVISSSDSSLYPVEVLEARLASGSDDVGVTRNMQVWVETTELLGRQYRPYLHANGETTVAVEVEDPDGNSLIVQGIMRILPVNDPPFILTTQTLRHNEGDTGLISVSGFVDAVVAGPMNESNQTIIATVVESTNDIGNDILVGDVNLDIAGNLSYELNGNPGTARFIIAAVDSEGGTGRVEVAIVSQPAVLDGQWYSPSALSWGGMPLDQVQEIDTCDDLVGIQYAINLKDLTCRFDQSPQFLTSEMTSLPALEELRILDWRPASGTNTNIAALRGTLTKLGPAFGSGSLGPSGDDTNFLLQAPALRELYQIQEFLSAPNPVVIDEFRRDYFDIISSWAELRELYVETDLREDLAWLSAQTKLIDLRFASLKPNAIVSATGFDNFPLLRSLHLASEANIAVIGDSGRTLSVDLSGSSLQFLQYLNLTGDIASITGLDSVDVIQNISIYDRDSSSPFDLSFAGNMPDFQSLFLFVDDQSDITPLGNLSSGLPFGLVVRPDVGDALPLQNLAGSNVTSINLVGPFPCFHVLVLEQALPGVVINETGCTTR